MTRVTALVALTVAVLATTILPAVVAPSGAASAAAAAPVTTSTVRTASAASVFSGGPYLQPTSTPARYAASLAASGDSAGSAAAATIARYPIAIWLGDWYSDAQLTQLLTTTQAAAAKAGTTPVYVTYAIPNRDCGGYSAGGMTATAYEAWTDRIASTLRGQRAVVVIEPDALAAISNCPAEATTRYTLLQHEVAALTAAGVPSYLDAGNSNWVPSAEMAARLVKAGVANARGFATNVSNYYPTADEQAYADRVSALTGGSHYVVDTSRNGRGWRGTWCNPPGAGLGTPPAVADGSTALDARLWIKTPGASDGTCNGGPVAGAWFSAYAQALVANRAEAPAANPAAPAPASPAPTPAAPTTAPATPAPTPTPRATGISADGTTLVGPTTVRGGQSIHSPNGQYRLDMQADGNLVVYGNGRALWSSGTSGRPGARLDLQADGNAVVYSSDGRALWSSGTNGRGTDLSLTVTDGGVVTATTTSGTVWRTGAPGTDTIVPTASLRAGQALTDTSGRRRLVMQADGNLVLYRDGVAAWASGTSRYPGAVLRVQADGNVVVYASSGAAVWSTGTWRVGGAGLRLVVQTDGNLVLYRGAAAVWASNTRG